MVEYRRRDDKDTWHWCKNCTNYPPDGSKYEKSSTKPTTGELDNQCKAKQKDNDCK